MLTPEQISNLPPDTKKEYLKTALLLEERKKEQGIRTDFLQFVKYMWPDFIAVSYTHLTLPKTPYV